MTAAYCADVQLLIDAARREHGRGDGDGWLQAAYAAIAHRKAGGLIEDNPFTQRGEEKLREYWDRCFHEIAPRSQAERRFHLPQRGSTNAAHIAAALED